MRISNVAHPARTLRIEVGEGRVVALMILYSAAAVGGVLTVGYNGVAETLFLSRLSSSDVPFSFILPGIAIVATLAAYNELASRVSLPRLASASSAFLLLLAVGFRLLLALGDGKNFALLAGIFLFCEVAASLVLVQFWTFAGQIFNPRQARRLFGGIAAGGTLSSVIAGAFLTLLVRSVGVDNLLLVVAANLGICGACALILRKHLPPVSPSWVKPAGPVVGERRSNLVDDLVAVWSVPLLRSIAALTVLVSLLINIGAYQFFLVLQSTYFGRGTALAGFLGGFAIWTGLAALAVQLSATGTVMRRYGIFAAQSFFPLAMALSAGAILIVWGALWAVSLTRAFDPVFRRTVHDASLNALYLPVPAELRQRAKTVLEGIYATTLGLSGIVFLAVQRVTPSWTYQYWSIPVLILAVLWIGLLVWTRRQYVAALDRSVNARRLDFSNLTLDVTDETTVSVLMQSLHSADDRKVIHVLDLLANAPGSEWLPQVAPLLTHKSMRVRVMALRCLAQASDPTLSDKIAASLKSPEGEVRSAAIAALGAIKDDQLIGRVLPFLDDPNPVVAGAAIAYTVRRGGDEPRQRAVTTLRMMLTSETVEMRREAATVIGALAGHAVELDVLETASSADLRIDPIACLAGMLADKEVRATAAHNLALFGDDALPAISKCLGDRGCDRATREQAARILQHIGGEHSVRLLVSHLSEPDDIVRCAVYRSLAYLGGSGAGILLRDTVLQVPISRELAHCYQLNVWRADLPPDAEDALLRDALGDRIDRAIDRIFWLLAIRLPNHDLMRTRQTLVGFDARSRAMAVELVDSLLDRALSKLLLPLIETSSENILEVAQSHFGIGRRSVLECIAELTASNDPWLRACAIFRIGSMREPLLIPLAIAGLESEDALVRETALRSCRLLLEPAQFAEILSVQANLTAFPSVRRYARSLLVDLGVA